jgi:hypothetical protein
MPNDVRLSPNVAEAKDWERHCPGPCKLARGPSAAASAYEYLTKMGVT